MRSASSKMKKDTLERSTYPKLRWLIKRCHGRQLFVHPIERSLVEELVKDIRKAGLAVMVGGPDVAYMENPDPEFEDWILNGYKFQAKSVADVLAVADQFIKVSAYRMSAGNKVGYFNPIFL